MDGVRIIYEERDLAQWFFDQKDWIINKIEPPGGGPSAWVVKRPIPKLKGPGNHKVRYELMGHSSVCPFDAIENARIKYFKDTGYKCKPTD